MNFDLLSFTVDDEETSLRVVSFCGADGRCWSLLAIGVNADGSEWCFDLFWLGQLLGS